MSWPEPQVDFQEYEVRDDDMTTHRYQSSWHYPRTKGLGGLARTKGRRGGFSPDQDLTLG